MVDGNTELRSVKGSERVYPLYGLENSIFVNMVAEVRFVDAKIFWGIFDDGAGKLDWVRGVVFFKFRSAHWGVCRYDDQSFAD